MKEEERIQQWGRFQDKTFKERIVSEDRVADKEKYRRICFSKKLRN